MKAPDIVESWKWEHGEKIIERLLARSAREPGQPTAEPAARPTKDIYYLAARRCAAMREAKRFRVEQQLQQGR